MLAAFRWRACEARKKSVVFCWGLDLVDAALTVDLVACDNETNGLWPEIDPVTRINQTVYSCNWVYNKFPVSILPAKAFTEG